MSDIKPLLKLMNKFGENKNLQKYTKIYYEFSENCQALVRYLTTESILQTRPTDVQEKITALKDLVPRIYTDLSILNEEDSKSNIMDVNNDAKDSSDEKQKLVRISSKTGKVVQEYNSYAVGVWKRVHQKLEGKDINPEISSTIQDQVNKLI
jgi:PI-3-kinase-related kinase SMG-1